MFVEATYWVTLLLYIPVLHAASALRPIDGGTRTGRFTPLLPTSLTNLLNNTTSLRRRQCYIPPYHFGFPTKTDCHYAIHGIYWMPESFDAREWTANASESWTWQTCYIDIRAVTIFSVDTFSYADIGSAATVVVADCVETPESVLGGWRRVGPKGEFTVSVHFNH